MVIEDREIKFKIISHGIIFHGTIVHVSLMKIKMDYKDQNVLNGKSIVNLIDKTNLILTKLL
jgi:hypothetical protein